MSKPGMIGFSNNKKGFLPAAIRVFTGHWEKWKYVKSDISHALVITKDVCNEPSVQEAGMTVQVVPFNKFYRDNKTQDYWLFSLTKATQQEMDQALDWCYKEYAAEEYGFLQLLWFVYRWFCVSVLRQKEEDVIKRDNWLSRGVICSEFQWAYLSKVNAHYAALVAKFNPDTVQADDLKRIALQNPDSFKFEESNTQLRLSA